MQPSAHPGQAAAQTTIPCVLMRGGTSSGPFFLAESLPADPALLDRVLLAVMGSPDLRQIDGIGGGDPTTSKVAIVSRSRHPHAQVDFLFAQVAVDRAVVDWAPSCGNMLSGVGPFALEAGLLAAAPRETAARIHCVNTGALVETLVQTPGKRVTYAGSTVIDGVPGSAAPVLCRYLNAVGGKTGALFPTGQRREIVEGIEVTCMDVAVPLVLMRAIDLGVQGDESREALDADRELVARMESIRRVAARRMGLGEVRGSVVPRMALLSAPATHSGSIRSRYFMPFACHPAHAVTGALCVAACAQIPGTVAAGLARVRHAEVEPIVIEHPSGALTIELALDVSGAVPRFHYAGVTRTARRLFEGRVLIPASVWDGR